MKAAIFAASLMPLADSTPVDTSTPHGWTRRIASATLPAERPPDTITGLSVAGTSDQSKGSPTPPYSGTWLSNNQAAAREKGRRYSSAGTPFFTLQAFTKGTPNCAQNSGVSSPWNCSIAGRTRPSTCATSAASGLTNSATACTKGGSASRTSAARSEERYLGLGG